MTLAELKDEALTGLNVQSHRFSAEDETFAASIYVGAHKGLERLLLCGFGLF